ncbi:WD repeat-containing protein [Aureococcus anophagefferens]|nr:WD repeat-containing protein [Aureococcus anophagefferens]
MPPAATSSKVAVGGGHKVTTVADGALASAAPPAEPDGAACVLPHRIPVDRLCVSRRSPPVAYSTGADGRVCCSGLGGNARASFGSAASSPSSWQFDLAAGTAGTSRAGSAAAARSRARPWAASRTGATRARLPASEVAKWDPRKLAAPSETVGFHQDVGVTLELCDAGLLSASRDGGVALWGTGGGLAGELRDRVLRVWDLAAGATSTRPCCECGGAGRQDLPSGSSCVCVACRGTGRSPVDAGFAPDDDENGDNDAETERPRGDGGAAAAAPPKPRPSITRASWLAKHAKQPDDKTLPATLPTVARVRASRPFAANFSDRRFEPGDLVLRNSLPEYKDAAPALVKRQGANEPAIRGNEVGEILNDDLSRVPYEVRGPRGGAPSWFEAVQLAVCPPERAPAGKVALAKARGAAKTPVPPTPRRRRRRRRRPRTTTTRTPSAPCSTSAPRRPRSPRSPAKPAVTDAERRAQRDAQRAADRNVDDSMAQYMAQKAARASAAGGGSRRPAYWFERAAAKGDENSIKAVAHLDARV